MRSWRYKGWASKIYIVVFGFNFVLLTWLGTQPATVTLTKVAQVASVIYFGFFAFLLIAPKIEKTKPVPERVTGGH